MCTVSQKTSVPVTDPIEAEIERKIAILQEDADNPHAGIRAAIASELIAEYTELLWWYVLPAPPLALRENFYGYLI